jgi:hypothetical protein
MMQYLSLPVTSWKDIRFGVRGRMASTSNPCGDGYIDEPKRESYLPDSVHGSQCHLSVLAKNALVLVSEYSCPHVFLTLTCKKEWPEI